MDEIIKDILIVIWLILTFIFFNRACKRSHVISFSAAKGFFAGSFGTLTSWSRRYGVRLFS